MKIFKNIFNKQKPTAKNGRFDLQRIKQSHEKSDRFISMSTSKYTVDTDSHNLFSPKLGHNTDNKQYRDDNGQNKGDITAHPIFDL